MSATGISVSDPQPVAADGLTIAAIGIAVYVLANVLHEGVGHAGACLLTGGKALVVSTVHMECSADNRLVDAGGTLMNLVAALLFFLLGRALRGASARARYFCWLAMSVNLFVATGYFLFSGIGGFGDWAAFIVGLGPQWLLRIALAVVGGLSYAAAARFSLLELRPLIGSDPQRRLERARRLMLIPYLTGGTLSCIAGTLNPAGWYLIALSAAASTFGGTSALAWMDNWLRNTRRIPLGSEPEPPAIERSTLWIAVAACLALVWVLVIGPGVHLSK
jgi:hypothetical protein